MWAMILEVGNPYEIKWQDLHVWAEFGEWADGGFLS